MCYLSNEEADGLLSNSERDGAEIDRLKGELESERLKVKARDNALTALEARVAELENKLDARWEVINTGVKEPDHESE